MEEVIRQVLIDYNVNEFSDNIFVNLDGTLKNKSGDFISRTFEAKVRGWHNIDKDEPIYALFYHFVKTEGDFFVSSRKLYFTACIRGGGISFCGIVETDGWGKEDNAHWAIEWNEIENVTFEKDVIQANEKENPSSYFIANDPTFVAYEGYDCQVLHFMQDNSYIYIPCLFFGNYIFTDELNAFVAGYQNLSQQNDDYYEWLWSELNRLENENDYQGLINLTEEAKENIRYDFYYHNIIHALIGLERYDEAEKYYNSFLLEFQKQDKKDENYSNIEYRFLLTETKLYDVYGMSYEAAENYDHIKQYLEAEYPSNTDDIQFYVQNKNQYYNSYITNFLNEDYNNRKVITIAKTNQLFKQDHITLLQMNNLPAVNFPITHPKQDHTYVCHPYKTDTYLPIEEYDYELLTDRINEYCYLLQCLGATSISIENTKGESSDTNTNNSSQINAEGSVKLYSGKINEAKNQRTRDYVKNMLKIGREQQFNPIKPPFVPDNLIWFPHEIGWQRLVRQRLEGNMLKHSEYMSSTDHKILSNSEMSDINGELKILLASLKGGQKQEKETNIESNQEIEWRINVEFKPIEAFGNNNYSANILAPQQIAEHTEAPTEKERQYMEEVRFMLEDDSIIDGQERKMLDEMQKTLNISAERAPLLEQEVINAMLSFTPNEQKYIEEIKFMLEDDGQIDEQERKMLDGMLKVLNISPERAQQLEIIVLNKGDLTKEEKEYIEKFKAFVTTDGVVSDRERRILNRLANLLGITEKRAIELEKQTTVD